VGLGEVVVDPQSGSASDLLSANRFLVNNHHKYNHKNEGKQYKGTKVQKYNQKPIKERVSLEIPR
jgi:hypothetical protein